MREMWSILLFAESPAPSAPDPIIRYTFWLVIVGVLQFAALIVQAVFLYRAFRETTRATGLTAQTLIETQRSNLANEALTLESNTNARISADAATLSANTARETLWKTERADVLLESVAFSNEGNIDPGTAITLILKNYGRTRANSLRPTFWLGVEGSADTQQTSTTVTLLGAGDIMSVPFPAMNQFVTVETFALINTGRTKLVFRGSLSYSDVFGFQHLTECAGTYDHRAHSFRVEKNTAD